MERPPCPRVGLRLHSLYIVVVFSLVMRVIWYMTINKCHMLWRISCILVISAHTPPIFVFLMERLIDLSSVINNFRLFDDSLVFLLRSKSTWRLVVSNIYLISCRYILYSLWQVKFGSPDFSLQFNVFVHVYIQLLITLSSICFLCSDLFGTWTQPTHVIYYLESVSVEIVIIVKLPR